MAERRPIQLRLVVAAAGYGKTTALRRLFPEPAARWQRECDIGALLGGGLAELAAGTGQLVLDGLPPMSEPVEQALLEAVTRLPDGVGVALSSRCPVGSTAPAWLSRVAPGQIRPADLGLPVEAITDLLDTEYGLSTPGLAERVWQLTAGWPALVRLVAETLVADGVPAGPLLPAVTEPGGLVASYVAAEVLAPLPPEIRSLLGALAELAPVTPGVCAAIGHPDAGRQIQALLRTGLLTRVGTDPDTGPGAVPVIAAVAGHGRPPLGTPTVLRAAAWYRAHGPPRAAACAFRLGG
ncbi:MAG TPA: hypothetical protein VF755_24495, partial [Catenuloplanes sp.]